ncbi:glycine betaine/L-proline ABC transporter ATP-binding protein [Prauserella halophila]|uniref:Glycine betaine/L-proline ABC transporter ATP-binding protein n=1 Tax=Prauserella halophila TaxID=185641 RepID=A0ABP4H6E3_9PSEU|nr:betaine/proline/choline family ABC transporter ATP-binding protein [Prauserella halophila]MCP2238024.1 glycine betaine/proline transport system ATP-binding protein [Prauserella halophila]
MVSSIQVEDLYKVFGRRADEAVSVLLREGGSVDAAVPGTTAAVVDVSFDVRSGEIFVVMGLSGSGKSTLLRMLNGILPVTHGRVYLDDVELTAMSARQIRDMRKRHMSMVFQHFALFPHRTVLQNAAYGLQVQGKSKQERLERAQESLSLVGLDGWENRLPEQLSGGMQQRVGLARALAADTDVLLMDEAFSALDPLIRREMQDQLLTLQQQLGKTIVFITHDLNEAMRLGDRIAVMRRGRIVQIGTAEAILTAPADDYVSEFVRDVDRARVLTARSVMDKPLHAVPSSASPEEALRMMHHQHVPTVLVVDEKGAPVGAVREPDATESVRQGHSTVAAAQRPVTRVQGDTAVSELFSAASGPAPLAVVDERGVLIGVVHQSALLAALGEVEHAPDRAGPEEGR